MMKQIDRFQWLSCKTSYNGRIEEIESDDIPGARSGSWNII